MNMHSVKVSKNSQCEKFPDDKSARAVFDAMSFLQPRFAVADHTPKISAPKPEVKGLKIMPQNNTEAIFLPTPEVRVRQSTPSYSVIEMLTLAEPGTKCLCEGYQILVYKVRDTLLYKIKIDKKDVVLTRNQIVNGHHNRHYSFAAGKVSSLLKAGFMQSLMAKTHNIKDELNRDIPNRGGNFFCLHKMQDGKNLILEFCGSKREQFVILHTQYGRIKNETLIKTKRVQSFSDEGLSDEQIRFRNLLQRLARVVK